MVSCLEDSLCKDLRERREYARGFFLRILAIFSSLRVFMVCCDAIFDRNRTLSRMCSLKRSVLISLPLYWVVREVPFVSNNGCTTFSVLYYFIELRTIHFVLSNKIKITTFDRLGFMFLQRCVVVKDVSVKERHF